MPKLTAANGILYLDGDVCDHIGFNYYSAMEKEWSNLAYDNGYRYKEDFPILKNRGIKIVKTMMTPFDSSTYTSVVGNSLTAVNANYYLGTVNGSYPAYSYYNGVDKFLETALDNDVGVILTFNWFYKTIADIFDAGNYSKWNDPNSNSRIHFRMFMNDFVTRYTTGSKANLGEAIAGWSFTNEAEVIFNNSSTSSTSSDINLEGYLGILSDAKKIVKSLDPYARIVCAQTTAPIVNARQKDVNSVSSILARYYGRIHEVADVVELHTYPDNKFMGVTDFVENKYPYRMGAVAGFESFLKEAVRYAASIRKPLFLGEFGVSQRFNAENSDVSPLAVTVSSVASGVSVIPCSNTTGISVGMIVSSSNTTNGTAVSGGTVITAVVPNTSFTIAPAAKTTTPTTLYVYQSSDTEERMFSSMVDSIKKAGVQLSLCWNWNESKYVSSQNVWSVYPNIDSARNYPTGNAYHNTRYKQIDIIEQANKTSLIGSPYSNRLPSPPNSFLRLRRQSGFFPCVGLTDVAKLPNFWSRFSANGGDFTISFWFRPNSISTSFPTIWRYGNDGINQIILAQQPLTGSVLPNIYAEGKTASSTTLSTAGMNRGLVQYEWQHMIISVKTHAVNKKQTKVYSQGVLVSHSPLGNYTFGQPNSSSTQVWTIGTGGNIASSIADTNFDMANLNIFGRAVTESEAYDIYNGVVPTDVIASYPFDDTNTYNDISGNQFHLATGANSQIVTAPIKTQR